MSERRAASNAVREGSGSAEPSDSRPPSFGNDWWTLLTDPAHLSNPYPELNRIRELAPIHYDSASGIYFVLGHGEFALLARAPEMGRDTRLWTDGWSTPKNKRHDPAGHQLFSEFQPQMTNANAPDHRRMRAVYEKAFRPGALKQHLPTIEAECQQLLDTLPVNSPVDFMSAFANLLPRRVALRLFDIPDAMEEQLARWVWALSLIGNVIMTPDQKRDAHTALREFKDYLRSHLAAWTGNPNEGFIGLALAASTDGTMDEEETLNNLVTLIAGTTTATLLGNGMLTLLRHPEQFDELRLRRSLLQSAMEEMLRFEPGSSIIIRVAIQDFQCGSVCIPAGSLAIGLVGAINRDPARFSDPDVFDICRTPNPHFVFGGGAHICIGAALVRMTAQVGFDAVMDRFSRIELAGDPVWWTHRCDQRGLHTLPVTLQQMQ